MPPRKKATTVAAKKTAKTKNTRATKHSKSKKEDHDSDYDPNEEEVSPSLVQDTASAPNNEVQTAQPEQPEKPEQPNQTDDNAVTDDVNPSADDAGSVIPDNNMDNNNAVNVDSGDRVNRDRYRIFVTRIPFEATSDDIENYFKQFGEVEDAYCPKQPGKAHLNKGFGFISFKNDEVLQAVFNARPHTILGREIVVDKATIRSEQQTDRKRVDYSRSKRSLDAPDRDSNKINRRANSRQYDRPPSSYSGGPPMSYSGGYSNVHAGYNQPPGYNSYDHGNYDSRSNYDNYNRSGSGYGQSSSEYNQGHGSYSSNYGQYGNRQSGYDRNYNNPPPYDRPYDGNDYNRNFDPNRSINYVFNGGEKDRRGENYDRHYQYDQNYQNIQYQMQQPPYSSTAQSYNNNYEPQGYDPSRPTTQGSDTLESKRLKNKLFVGRMRNDTTVATMRNYFERFGELIDAYIPKDPKTQKGKGFGFISFHNETSVRAVLQATYKHVIDGREVIVDMADADQKKNR
ncbi:nucleic acid binding protein, putative [Babesia microti strain RI]|uniref:Nucleic acid binding protein, putative n=1 Tax=Babesia microti (strain RI) TaxID=1133968 RepID=A0A1N6LXI0_BABMR|nr:nucleic acid binding protein, putative [Babesia microti strain RI]SIO73589.1 nucleic acid binding protein, putative [Babesia microti strain RI]|eukprot:XP_021337674.1 nucleic acid binding protein, putative [Babesia microti strain RI]